MLAAIYETPFATWFFKSTDAKHVIDAAEPELLSLFESARIETSPPMPVADGSEITQPNIADSKLLSYNVPTGWREDSTPRTARVATLMSEQDPPIELAITRFPGDVGGELANVNRWRGQIGLAPISSLSLQDGSNITISGVAARMYQLRSESDSPSEVAMTVALVKVDDHTWFFKMSGQSASVAHERERFIEFLESVRFDVSR
jgi:hypothetical protein